ncbi:MAG TPA: hypothetical protein VME01_10265, partial [Solirubrobacteraceae bacterium]|nr:hypothetical protein [Solirubrobacteraceae bacterium]
MTETGQSSDLLVAITRLRDATVDAGCAAPFAGEPEAQTTVRLYNQLLQLRQARALYCQATGNDRFFFDPAPEEREREFEILQEAVTAFAAGRLHLAVWRGVSACALDPNDEHAVLLTDRALGALRGAASPPDSDARRRFQPRPPRHVSHARAFVAIADADEVGADAQMLRAWTSTFAPEDQATLAIVTPPSELEATQQRLVQVLPGAGLSVDTEYDLAIIACPRERLPELVREAHARFTGSGPSRDARLDGLPGFGVDPASLVALRAAAQRRWSYAGAGRALRIVIKIPAHGWEEAAGWGDTFFAQQFAEALTLRGHAVALEVVPEW